LIAKMGTGPLRCCRLHLPDLASCLPWLAANATKGIHYEAVPVFSGEDSNRERYKQGDEPASSYLWSRPSLWVLVNGLSVSRRIVTNKRGDVVRRAVDVSLPLLAMCVVHDGSISKDTTMEFGLLYGSLESREVLRNQRRHRCPILTRV
jgi:hypothetical protein